MAEAPNDQIRRLDL
ncbi:hypothetical protein, partial [Frankia sp. AvcI1]